MPSADMVRRYFAAYRTKDGAVGRTACFARCWPTVHCGAGDTDGAFVKEQ